MSTHDKLKRLVTERRDSRSFFVWRLTRPKPGESCRWEAVDGRWITLALGHGDEMGLVTVLDSAGRREVIDSFEGALALAKSWRT